MKMVSHLRDCVEVMDFRIIAHCKPRQAAVRIKTPTGWTNRIRLKDAYGKRLLLQEGKSPEDMGPEFMYQCTLAAMQIAQASIQNETFRTPNRRFRTCQEAMKKFEVQCDRDHHGNAFKEYFKDKPLAAVNQKSVPEFIEWLMKKYNANEATVSKKVFAGSALFKWMAKKGWWVGTNPFYQALSGVKFAPAKQFKDVVEPDEVSRLRAALMEDQYRDLRILCELLYHSGLRPYEALEVKWENIDAEKLVLSYLRTKRRNKSPDWRRIPIPAKLLAFLTNEGATKGRLVDLTPRKAAAQMKKVTESVQIGGLTLKTFRKDFSYRARLVGASVDDVNLYQGREETILEKHYTTNKWFISQQCRWWVDKMFGDRPPLERIK